MRRMKIIIVGLPLFAKRLQEGLSKFDSSNRYSHLDTYYSKKDKVKAALQVPRADCIFSINGAIVSSGVFDLAFKKNVPIIMNWVGTDVLKAIDAYKNNKHQQHYIDRTMHFCEVDWIQEELKEIGINAEVVNFAAFDKSFELAEVTSTKLSILSYIPENRSEFYGMNTMIRLAKKFPDVNFTLAGTEGTDFAPLPNNLKALGWVSNMGAVYNQAHACLRYTDHDGLSSFILESMARGKQVLYRNPFNHCAHCPTEEALESEITTLKTQLNEGKSLINADAAAFIKDKFSEAVIFGGLIDKITEIVRKS
tara:strand:+ start:6291 stop:7217 length:927 start_codon:yes stop_codon:yes gene_type:complete